MKINRPYDSDNKVVVYIVPTPIGNLQDITYRAIDILNKADIIACEDTRVTKKLLDYYNIKNKTIISLYSQNEITKSEKILEIVKKENKILAYLSDAGTPGISDPGALLVQACYSNNISVTCLPGPSALICGLVESNIDTSHFTFLGFLPVKENKIKQLLSTYSNSDETLIFYESPNRVIQTLKIMEEVFGGDRNISLVRELTKIHEEVTNGTIKEVLEEKKEIKGECIIIVDKAKKQNIDSNDLNKIIEKYKKERLSTNDIAKKVSLKTGISKKVIYNKLLEKDD